MYEETAGVPLILAGPEVPVGAVCDTPVTHVDAYPTIVEGVGIPLSEEEQAFPGFSLLDIAQGSTPQRTVLSEYHGMGSTTGAFMIRNGRFKYVHYAKYRPQLFDLDARSEKQTYELQTLMRLTYCAVCFKK